MNPGTVYRKKEDIVTRKIAGETLLVPIRSQVADMQKIFALDNQVAEYIWQQLDGRQSLQEIRAGIVDSYDVEEERAGADIRDFIQQMIAADVIEEVSDRR